MADADIDCRCSGRWPRCSGGRPGYAREKIAAPHLPLIETPVADGCPVKVQVTLLGLSLAFRCTVPPPENDP